MTAETSIDFAAETFSNYLDTDTTCEIAGVLHVRYADDQWRGWIPVEDLRRAQTRQEEIESAASAAAYADTDYECTETSEEWTDAYRRWVWQLLHDLTSGVEDARDAWAAVFGDRADADVRAEGGDDIKGWITAAVAEARKQGAGLSPDVVEQLLEEVETMTEAA